MTIFIIKETTRSQIHFQIKQLQLSAYRWYIRILGWKMNIKEEKPILIWSASCSNNHSPEQIHPIFIDSHKNCICPINAEFIYDIIRTTFILTTKGIKGLKYYLPMRYCLPMSTLYPHEQLGYKKCTISLLNAYSCWVVTFYYIKNINYDQWKKMFKYMALDNFSLVDKK